jgi:RNA polymerase sigma factor (sigma-70 family)
VLIPLGVGILIYLGFETTQPSLLSRVRDQGDHAAWREFDEKYRGLILRYCRRRGLQPTDAEDIRQLVMINMSKRLTSFEYKPDQGRFRDYLGRTVQNAIYRWFRRPRRDAVGLESHVIKGVESDEGEPLDEVWEQEWMLHHYRLAMRTVRETSENKSVLVFEQLLAGENLDAVAETFSMTRAAVHKVKQRMRDRLKECIERQIQEEEMPPPTT